MSKNRLEAFSDGVFAIILTILVLELKVPEIKGNSMVEFFEGVKVLLPKLISFSFSFFLIAIFWVNHHNVLHHIEKTDTKLLWLNILFLFFSSLFPFVTAFIGDYYTNPFVVALYPLNMFFGGLVMRKIWIYSFIESDLAPNSKLTPEEKTKETRKHDISTIINLFTIVISFVYLPLALIVIMIMPLFFVILQFSKQKNLKNKYGKIRSM